eukprot:Awhi_evm1s15498
MNLGALKLVTGVVTQGRGKDVADTQCVSSFQVQYSRNGVDFYDVDGAHSFAGNGDASTKKFNKFSRPFRASYVRIYPQTYLGSKALRAGVVVMTESKSSIRSAVSNRGYLNALFDIEVYSEGNYTLSLDFESTPRWEFVNIAHNKYHLVYNNQLLSASADGLALSLVDADDDSGRQQWYIIPATKGSSRQYNLRVADGTPMGKYYLSSSEGNVGTFSLVEEDDGTGRQHWSIDTRAL